MHRQNLAAAGLMAALLLGQAGMVSGATNIIVMISDGQGFNTVKATEYYMGQQAVYEGSNFIRMGMQTSSANNPAGYNPASMAANFNFANGGATDSASAATAMFTGVKNWDGDVNMTTSGTPLRTFFEEAALYHNMSIGAVSSVEFTHATPAAVFGHNDNRNNYSAMALEAINGSNPNANNGFYNANNYNGNLKVVMGTGHPNFNADGQPMASNYGYVGGSSGWSALQGGSNGWTLVETAGQFQALGTGPTPDKVFGVAQNISTLQQGRTPANTNDPPVGGSGGDGTSTPYLANQPTLVDMTKAALNVLDNNTNGFAVMIEGGAVDWANHANQLGRMIEEQMDFNAAVQAVVDWVDANSSWDETLLIVTADHECGHLWGNGNSGYFDVNGDTNFTLGVDYGYIGDNGQTNLPNGVYFSSNHSNALVPLYARGVGSDLLLGMIEGTDTNLAGYYNLDAGLWSGAYIDNTAIAALGFGLIPEPGSVAALVMAGAFGLVRFLRARRK